MASHIKPWHILTNEERLNSFNGFLFASMYASALDRELSVNNLNGPFDRKSDR